MNTKILKLIENNARMSTADIATVLGITEKEVSLAIRDMESSGIIRGYKTIIDREKLDENAVSATIELKVVPRQTEALKRLPRE
jgi:DNA-binding Lrp family transcriptional regulator